MTDYSKKINGYDITNTYVGTNGSVQPGDPTQPTEPTNPTNPATPSTPSTDPSKPVTPSKPPKTGDEFPLTLWLVLGAIGLCGFATMLVLLHKTKNTYQGKRLKKKGKRLMKKRRRSA